MASASPLNPQTFNRYSYVGNSPLTMIDPTGMFGICPGGGQIGQGGVTLGTFSLGEATEEEPDQQQEEKLPTNEVKVGNVTVKVEQMNEPAAFDNKKINGVARTGVGVQLVFTFTENGQPVSGATVTESVVAEKGDPITQNNQPVPLDSSGRGSDFVTNSAPTPTNQEQAQKVYNRVMSPFVTVQKATFTLTLASGSKIAITQVRSLTNLTAAGGLQPHDPKLGTPGYTFKMEPLKARVVK
jgi:hypothetical protein